MVTKKRPWFPGACYHITNRGNNKQKIFLDDDDYKMYMYLLKDTLKFYEELNFKLISYCLMPNHIHLLLKTDSQDPAIFMRRLNSLYAKYFNNKYEYVGHLFQGRYFSNIITSDYELLEISKYIHLNPVKANIVKLPENYTWSSFSKILSNSSHIPTNLYIHSEEILDIIDIYFLIENSRDCLNINKNFKNLDKKEKYKLYVNMPLGRP